MNKEDQILKSPADVLRALRQSPGAMRVVMERARQVDQEGFDESHDDQYAGNELIQAAGCFLSHASNHDNGAVEFTPPREWPWDSSWWKPKSAQSDITRGAALAIAEIDRRNREIGQVISDNTSAHFEMVAVGRETDPFDRFRPFQDRVYDWLRQCFGDEIALSRKERAYRFLEEALELVQAAGVDEKEVRALSDYVFGRPKGELEQEVGGAQVTLAAFCAIFQLDMEECGNRELDRVRSPEVIEKVRHKQAAKPQQSPLPGIPREGSTE